MKAEAQPEPKSVRLGFVAGMIAQDKLTPFERLLFRATRGNMFLKSSPVGAVLDPTTSEKQEKAVFVVFFAGDRARTKIMKVRAGSLQHPSPPGSQVPFLDYLCIISGHIMGYPSICLQRHLQM